jgi:hypothetical protein
VSDVIADALNGSSPLEGFHGVRGPDEVRGGEPFGWPMLGGSRLAGRTVIAVRIGFLPLRLQVLDGVAARRPSW